MIRSLFVGAMLLASSLVALGELPIIHGKTTPAQEANTGKYLGLYQGAGGCDFDDFSAGDI